MISNFLNSKLMADAAVVKRKSCDVLIGHHAFHVGSLYMHEWILDVPNILA